MDVSVQGQNIILLFKMNFQQNQPDCTKNFDVDSNTDSDGK